jgi:hypothetical protein
MTQPVPRHALAGGPAVRSAPGVGDPELEHVRAKHDRDAAGGGAGVLDRIGERLLHDPICDQIDPRLQRLRPTLDPDVDRQPRRTSALRERIELPETRCRVRELFALAA